MKRQVGIWMNSDKAVLINLRDGKEEQVQTIESDIEAHPHNPGENKQSARAGTILLDVDKKQTHRKNHQMHEYFEKIMHSIASDTSDIYIFGPANTKKHFEKELKKHSTYSSKKLEVESADKMTHPQMIAKVKQHFTHNGNGKHKS